MVFLKLERVGDGRLHCVNMAEVVDFYPDKGRDEENSVILMRDGSKHQVACSFKDVCARIGHGPMLDVVDLQENK